MQTIRKTILLLNTTLLSTFHLSAAEPIAPINRGPTLEYGSSYYQIATYDQSLSWHEAVDSAAALTLDVGIGYNLPGRLATITSAGEQMSIESILPPVTGPRMRVWIGGQQSGSGPEPAGGWEWISGEPWDYTNWDSFEPNNSPNGEDFLAIKVGSIGFETWGTWNDDLANSPFAPARFGLVEFDASAVPEPQTIQLALLGLGAFGVWYRQHRRRHLP